jgi:hypothetical protein
MGGLSPTCLSKRSIIADVDTSCSRAAHRRDFYQAAGTAEQDLSEAQGYVFSITTIGDAWADISSAQRRLMLSVFRQPTEDYLILTWTAYDAPR